MLRGLLIYGLQALTGWVFQDAQRMLAVFWDLKGLLGELARGKVREDVEDLLLVNAFPVNDRQGIKQAK